MTPIDTRQERRHKMRKIITLFIILLFFSNSICCESCVFDEKLIFDKKIKFEEKIHLKNTSFIKNNQYELFIGDKIIIRYIFNENKELVRIIRIIKNRKDHEFRFIEDVKWENPPNGNY